MYPEIYQRDQTTKVRVDPGEEPSIDWAIELLTKDHGAKPSVFSKYMYTYTGVILGFGFPCFSNLLLKKPIHTGIYRHVIGAAIGYVIGDNLRKIDEQNANRRTAFMLDYIKQHPERFPPPPSHTYAEVFEPWIPIR